MLINDRQITISAAGSRRATQWPAQTLLWSELVERLRTPVRGTETLDVYLSWPKSKQDDAKDVGGFVAGTLAGGRRKAGNVTGRDVLTLDLDSIPAGGTQDVLRRIAGLGCAYCVYSTRKHQESAPRLRVLFPLTRTCTADEYEPAARKMAQLIGMELCDPSTFEASRLMYWPSCSANSQYIHAYEDKPMADTDGLLAMYGDWHNMAEWPQVPGAVERTARLADKQEDPAAKKGIVGAFCRVYDIYTAIAELIPGEYVQCDTGADRYTYTGGSTSGGAVIYDNGKFLYSHHATDPAGGKLCNAFDLVRLHKFGALDDEAKADTPANKLPSYTAMCTFAAADMRVADLMNQEKYNQAAADFGETPEGESTKWMRQLKCNSVGAYDKTIDNIWTILENDHRLRGKFALNEFANRGEVFGELPWDKRTMRRQWEDNDNYGAYWYIEKIYGITANSKIDGALSLHSKHHAFNEVTDYLNGLEWDGTSRLDTLLIDYLGAQDNPYTRAVTRKAFTAAVARAMSPGIKFDIMTVLSGPQGIGKSTLIRKMSRGWFTDSLVSFDGKEASELVQGVWIIEVGELGAMRKADVNRVKQFMSQQIDRFRAAYARHVKDCPRCCIFFGTSNNHNYLQDDTGNRRFWPVDTAVVPPTKSVFRDLDSEIDQLWAEAVVCWKLGEPLYLSGEIEEYAKTVQEDHREVSPQEGIIADYLDTPVPPDWPRWDLAKRRMYLEGAMQYDGSLIQRDKVCAMELWCEALGNDQRLFKKTEARELNSILERMPGWERMKNPARFGYCKLQRGFEKAVTF